MAAKLNEGGDLCSTPALSYRLSLTRAGDYEIGLSGEVVIC